MSARARPQRGFSLVELMIALGVGVIIIAGAVGLMISTQHHFQSTSGERALQEAARVALGHVTNNLRNTGYGVDPALAFDLGPLTNVRIDQAYSGQTFSTSSTPSAGGGCTGLCRDSTTGPDEIVFYARDPAFGPHPLTVAASSSSAGLVVAGPVNVPLQRGQVLQVACYSGGMTWAYVTVSGAATDNGDGTVTIPIAGSGTTFPKQNAWLDDPCFQSVATVTSKVLNTATLTSAAEVFKIDRYRYFVATYDDGGNVRPWGTAGARPYLMLDQGLKDSAGNAIQSVVAPDVEDLQLAYVFPGDAATPLVGATSGAAISNSDTGINLAPGVRNPDYADAPDAPTRATHHPGNIGAVRVYVVVRSPVADPNLPNSATLPAAGNRDVTAGPPGYSRLLVDTTVAVPNLATSCPYFPGYGGSTATSGNRQLNVGGG